MLLCCGAVSSISLPSRLATDNVGTNLTPYNHNTPLQHYNTCITRQLQRLHGGVWSHARPSAVDWPQGGEAAFLATGLQQLLCMVVARAPFFPSLFPIWLPMAITISRHAALSPPPLPGDVQLQPLSHITEGITG